jgi:LCP family protein required for cell wall assembly
MPLLKNRRFRTMRQKHLKFLWIFFLACLLTTGCGRSFYMPVTGSFLTSEERGSTARAPSPIKTSTPTLTLTPLPPPTQTPTPTPTSIHPWGYFLGPTADSELEIPAPVEPVDFPPQTVNIILLGSDRRPDETQYRTDTLLILSLDPVSNRAKMLSIPRDFYVYIPGWKMNRINTAEPRGGFEMFADTVLYNLGIPLHHWVKVEFTGMSEAIDILGGIEIQSTGYLSDECGGTYYRIEPNKTYPMDGFTALCYARMRKRSSDFDRLRRQQEVFQAMFDKLFSLEGLWELPELFKIFKHTLQSDLTLTDILPLAPLAAGLALQPERIERFRIDQSMVQNWRTPKTGAAVLLPKPEAIQALLQEAFGP